MEIYVYGTGCGAGELIDSALPAERVTAFVDERPVSDSFPGRPVIRPEALAGQHDDMVMAAAITYAIRHQQRTTILEKPEPRKEKLIDKLERQQRRGRRRV